MFKVTHIQPNGTLAPIKSIKAKTLKEAYDKYLSETDADVMALVNAGDKTVMAHFKNSEREDKTMKTNKSASKTVNTNAVKENKAMKNSKTEVKAKAIATMALNKERNGVELKFNEKPSAEVRAQLKALKFRWHNEKKLWYAKQSEQTIALAKALCEAKDEPKVKAQPKAEAKKSTKKSTKKSQPKAEAKKPAPKAKAQPKAEEPKAEVKKPSRRGIESYKPKDGERICDRLIKALERTEGLEAKIVKLYEDREGWLYVTGESTREHKETLKKLGFIWSGSKKAWMLSPAPIKNRTKAQYKSMDALNRASIA